MAGKERTMLGCLTYNFYADDPSSSQNIPPKEHEHDQMMNTLVDTILQKVITALDNKPSVASSTGSFTAMNVAVTIATEVMAHIQRIERMPKDALNEIMTRIGGQPNGAADTARAFSLSKTFRVFVEDEDFLCAVSFIDLIPSLDGRYKQLLDVDGLVVRCSQAGNPSAQFILSKVVLVSSSMLRYSMTEAATSDVSADQISTISTENFNISDLYQAARLHDHLSAHHTNYTVLLDLIRNFLSRANVRDFTDMSRHLKNFVALYLVPGRESHHRHFLATLDNLCGDDSYPLVFTAEGVTYIPEMFNQLCDVGYGLMQVLGTDEEVLRSLQQCIVQRNEDVNLETLIERVDAVENILNTKGQVPSTHGTREMILEVKKILIHNASNFRKDLMLAKKHERYFQIFRRLLLAIFDALFKYYTVQV